ncbi:F-box/FBD/LRR-repeat protein [Trifolium repens]|nr:F-box/FBD/LRR-repeat protein [Trifolium repens]
MSNSADETMVQQTVKRAKLSEAENKDRLSDLPDCVILHILSFLNTEKAVQTCVLSSRYKDLWKHLPALILHSYSCDFPTVNVFTKFVSRVLSLRDSSIPLQSLHFGYIGSLDPQLIKGVANYAISYDIQRLGLSVYCDIEQLPPSIFSCKTITYLDLSVYPVGYERKTVFPKSFNMPALTTLNLGNFDFCASDNNSRAEPFSSFNRLNTLVLRQCLGTFAFIGKPYQKVSGSGLSYVKHVDINAEILSMDMQPPRFLLSWLLELVNTKSLTVTASTLQVLFLNANLLKIKLPSLGNLKFLKVKKELLPYVFLKALNKAKFQKIKSPKEAGLEPSAPIPDGIVEFLIQNSPLAEVEIIDCT